MATKKQTTALYAHKPRPHVVSNVNMRHQQERLGFNQRLAVFVSRNVGTMICAYLFAGIGIGSIVFVLTGEITLAAIFGSLSSYFLQLVLLPIIMVGQNVQGRHAELQADEQFHATMNTLHDAEQMTAHLNEQDKLIIQILHRLTNPPEDQHYLTAMTQPMQTMNARKP